MNNQELGKWGEGLAAQYLTAKGYRIIEKNYSCKLGEVDLIVTGQDYLVIVEVKTRRNTNFGLPQAAVDFHKQLKLRRLATYYLAKQGMEGQQVRFDVISIFKQGEQEEVLHLENAF